MGWICSHCGTANEKNFCIKCGAPKAKQATPAPAPATEAAAVTEAAAATEAAPTPEATPASQPDTIFCRSCGARNSKATNFCVQCGAPLSGEPAAPASKRNQLLLLGGGILVLLAVVIGLFFLLRPAPAKPAAAPASSSSSAMQPGGDGSAPQEASEAAPATVPERQLDERYSMTVEQIDTTEYPKVKLYLSVTGNQDGMIPPDLDKVFFRLQEKTEGMNDYLKREITNVLQLDEKESLNTCLVMDVSGSMSGQPLLSAQQMLIDFLRDVQFGYGDRIGLIAFSSDVYEIMNFTSDRTQMIQSIEQMVAMDQTALYDALYRAVERTSLQNGAKCVIAFTDGADNDSRYGVDEVAALAQQYKIPIFIIGTGVDSNYQSKLGDLCAQTNGYYRNINDIGSVADIYKDIYQQQKELYLVEYRTDSGTGSNLSHDVELELRVDYTQLPDDGGNQQNPEGTGTAQVSYKPDLLVSAEDGAADDASYAEYMERNAPQIIQSKKEKYRVQSVDFLPLSGIKLADRFENGIARIQGNNDKWGIVNTRLEQVVAPIYDKLFYANDGMIVVSQNNKWGYINTNGEVKVPLEWDGFADADVSQSLVNKEVPFMVFSEGRGIVLKNGRYGYVDRDGVAVIPAQFEDAKPFQQGLAAVKKGGKWGYINKLGEFVIPPRFDDAGSFAENRAPARENGGKYGYIDLTGKFVIAPRFDQAEDFESESGRRYAKVFEGKQCGFIQVDGSYKIDPTWKDAWNYADGYAMVRDDDGKYGYVDARGNVKLSPRYNMAYRSNLGIIAYCDSDGKWGYDDISGRRLVSPDYDFATNFSQGIARVQNNVGKTTTVGMLDGDCRMLTNGLEYENIGYPGEGYCPAKKDGEWGYVRLNYASPFLQ